MRSLIEDIQNSISEKLVYIYHHNDADGRCSGAIAYRYYTGLKKNVELREINYGVDYKVETIPDGSLVAIVDFNLEPEQIKDLWSRGCTTVWIDHHITAIKKYVKAGLIKDEEAGVWDSRLEGIAYSSKKSAAYLCWEFFYPNQPVPEAVRLVSVFDTWDVVPEKPRADNLVAGISIMDDSPESEDWDRLFVDSEFLETVETHGAAICAWRLQFANEYAKFPAEFEGYNVLCCNLSGIGSFAFGDETEKKEYDFLVSFCFTGKDWKYGLYGGKADVNLGEIAAKYGGGGHRNSSGFSTKDFIFK